jgi:hypothetical protein
MDFHIETRARAPREARAARSENGEAIVQRGGAQQPPPDAA